MTPGRPASTPDRIDDWLVRRPPHAHLVVLAYEGLNGLEEIELMPVQDLPNDGAGQLLLMAAQDHCDDVGQVGRYIVQLRAKEGGVITTKPIRVVPDMTELPPGTDAIEGASAAGIIGQALRHNETVMRMYVNSMGSVLGRMHDLLRLEQAENEILRRRVREQTLAQDDTSEIDAEESVLRKELLEKITNIATDVVLPAVATRWANGGQTPPGGGAS